MQFFIPAQPGGKHPNKTKTSESCEIEGVKPENFILSTWRAFSRNTSIHGVHYLTEPSFNLKEKFVWTLALVIASIFMVYSCTMLSNRFNTSMLSTVFESTSFKVSEIPFPAISLCNNNRLNFSRTEDALVNFLPNCSSLERETFLDFVHVLQNMEMGSFDEFDVLVGRNLSRLNTLNVTKVYEFFMHDCEGFFGSCWWKNFPFKCCEWFSKQRTEYGLCWSFNSFTNVGTKFINVRRFSPPLKCITKVFPDVPQLPLEGFEKRPKISAQSYPQHAPRNQSGEDTNSKYQPRRDDYDHSSPSASSSKSLHISGLECCNEN